MITGSVKQEDKAILNLFAYNFLVSKHKKQNGQNTRHSQIHKHEIFEHMLFLCWKKQTKILEHTIFEKHN